MAEQQKDQIEFLKKDQVYTHARAHTLDQNALQDVLK